MKNRAKRLTHFAKILCLCLMGLLTSGCSYYGGQSSSSDFTDDSKKNLANRQAAEKFWQSVRLKSNLSDAHYRLGLHYQRVGAHDKAIGEFTQALRNDGSYCKAFNGIAMTYDLLKRCEPAEESYERAIQCAPGEAYLYNNYACSSLLCGNYSKGLELLRQAEHLAGNDTRIKSNLKIARTIAIRENLSGYLKDRELSLPTTEKAPLPATTQALPDLQAPPESVPGAPAGQGAADVPAADALTHSPEVYTRYPVAESCPVLPQKADIIIPIGENKNDMLDSAPAIPTPAPKKVAIEISNGNGTAGMAKRGADFLRGHGFTVRSVTNANHFRFAESVIYFREEHLQAARNLAAVIPGVQNLKKVESMTNPAIGIRVLLGRDQTGIFPVNNSRLAVYRPTGQLTPAAAANSLVN